MRYYAVNNKGEIIAEGDTEKYVELLLSDIGYTEKRLEEEEVEIIKWK